MGFTLIFPVQTGVSEDYRIGPKDVLDLNVTGMEDLNLKVRVSEDGKISLPFLGEVEVEGLTATELENQLKELLGKDLLQDPQVTVFIAEHQSKRVSVLGAVQSPGPYELLVRQRLMTIISEAGGLTNEAGDDILIIRDSGNGTNTTLAISIEDLFVRGNADLNIPLEPDDVINVPIDQIVKVFVMGQVRSPGALAVKRSEIPTLLRAIAEAGGFAERASKGGVIVKRKLPDGKEQKIKVNVKDIINGKKPDLQLQEEDVVVVPESIF
jgi:polysaccharide biosynthesis/export protein